MFLKSISDHDLLFFDTDGTYLARARTVACPVDKSPIPLFIFGADASVAQALKRLAASVVIYFPVLLQVGLRRQQEAPAHQCLWDPPAALFRYIFPQPGPYRLYGFQEDSSPTVLQEYQIRLALAA